MENGPRSSLRLLGAALLTFAGLAAIAIGIIMAMLPADDGPPPPRPASAPAPLLVRPNPRVTEN